MKPLSQKGLFCVSAALAIVAGVGVYRTLEQARVRSIPSHEQATVLVTKVYVKPGQRIDGSVVEEVQIPPRYLQPAAFRKLAEILDSKGRPLYAARLGLLKGEQVTRPRTVEETGLTTLSWALEPEKIAVSLELSAAGSVGHHIKPGDWVCVFAMFDPQPGISEARLDAIERRVQVVAVNDQIGSGEMVGIEKSKGRGLSNESILVTLSAAPAQAGRILLARDQGRIALGLYSALDESPAHFYPVRIPELRRDGPSR